MIVTIDGPSGSGKSTAARLLAERLGITPDAHHPQGMMLNAQGHQVVDLGDDFYTVGRPHPMIDPSLRNQLIAELGKENQVGVLLLDVVIGYGATADPAQRRDCAKACHAVTDRRGKSGGAKKDCC